MKKNYHEIIVCGAGMVGMTFALLMSQRNINVCLIEKNAKSKLYTNKDSRTTAVSQGSSRIFEKLGIWNFLEKEAEHVEGADKLLCLKLDLGPDSEGKPILRQVFSGIKSAYQPHDLLGKLTVVVANLQARKMKFGISEGMILAAGPGEKDIWLLEPDSGATPGLRVT